MNKAKRRWWLADERFAEVHRKLRLNYSLAVENEFKRHLDELAAEKKRYDDRVKGIELNHAADLVRMDERLVELAKEIALARLYFGPTKWGMRYELLVRFEESYVASARSIIDTGPMIVQVMCNQIQNALATIDFARVKREDPRRAHERGEAPRMFIDAPTEEIKP